MAVQLRRLGPGQYVTIDGRFEVQRQEGVTECDHPLCGQLHERFMENGQHWCFYYPWRIWDTLACSGRGDWADPREFDTKRDAVAALEVM